MKKIILLVLFVGLLAGCENKSDLRWDLARAVSDLSSYKEMNIETINMYEAMVADLRSTHAAEIASIEEKYIKAELITPTDVWIDSHGDSLDSWQVFNTKIALENIQILKGLKNEI